MTQVPVYVIDEETNEYFSFSSQTDAATFLDVHANTVGVAAKEDRTIKGHYKVTKTKPRNIVKHVPASAEKEKRENYVSPRTKEYFARQEEAIAKCRAVPEGRERDKLIQAYNDWAAKKFPDVHADFVSMFDF